MNCALHYVDPEIISEADPLGDDPGKLETIFEVEAVTQIFGHAVCAEHCQMVLGSYIQPGEEIQTLMARLPRLTF